MTDDEQAQDRHDAEADASVMDLESAAYDGPAEGDVDVDGEVADADGGAADGAADADIDAATDQVLADLRHHADEVAGSHSVGAHFVSSPASDALAEGAADAGDARGQEGMGRHSIQHSGRHSMHYVAHMQDSAAPADGGEDAGEATEADGGEDAGGMAEDDGGAPVDGDTDGASGDVAPSDATAPVAKVGADDSPRSDTDPSSQPDAEPASPSDADPDDIVPDGIVSAGGTDGSFARGVDDVADVSDALDDDAVAPQDSAQTARFDEMHDEMRAAGRRRARLRVLLAFAVVVLVAAICVLGILIYSGRLSPNVTPSDTEELASPAAGTEDVTFEPVDSSYIPQLAAAFGLDVDEAVALFDGTVTFTDGMLASTDERIPRLRKMREGGVYDADGTEIATVGLGVDKQGSVVYAYCLFDLDALAVADATFEELAQSDVVAASLLEALGCTSDAIDNATLTGEPVATSDVLDELSLSGATGLVSPATFEVVESYDSTIGQVTGDNSVMRKTLVELY